MSAATIWALVACGAVFLLRWVYDIGHRPGRESER